MTDPHLPDAPADLPRTLGALRASGHEHRSVKDELRENLVARLRSGDDPFPGVVGIEETVRPQLERAILAGHDLVLLGERGQGKTRLLRTLVGLLDEWTPVIEGSELHEHPYHPVTVWARRVVSEHGDSTPVSWRHRSERYGEKLAMLGLFGSAALSVAVTVAIVVALLMPALDFFSEVSVSDYMAGCKSWADLPAAISLAGSSPVLSDTDFNARKNQVAAAVVE